MRNRLNFRQKIIFGHILLFLAFVVFAFPFIEKIVGRIVFRNIESSSLNLIQKLKETQSDQEMISLLKKSHGYFFLRVTLFDDQGNALYDSAEAGHPLPPAELAEAKSKKIVFSIEES